MALHELFILVILLGAVLSVLFWFGLRRFVRSDEACLTCGYSMRSSSAERCPECGADWGTPAVVGAREQRYRRSRTLFAGLQALVLCVVIAYVFIWWTENSQKTGPGNYLAVYWAVLTHPVLDDQAVWLRGERVLWAPGGSNVANMDSPPDPNRLLLVVARVDMPDHGTPMDRKIQSGVTLELERTNAGAPWNIGDNVVLSRAALEDWVQEAIPDASVSTTQTQCDLLDQVLATPWNGTVAMPQGFQMRGMSTKYLDYPNTALGQFVILLFGLGGLAWILLAWCLAIRKPSGALPPDPQSHEILEAKTEPADATP